MTNRIPQIPSVQNSDFLHQVRELLLIREGKAPNALEQRFITFADLVDPDFINSLAGYEFPITDVRGGRYTGDRTPPNPPTNLAVTAAFFQNNVTWQNPLDDDLYFIEVYMASVDDGDPAPALSTASRIAVVTQDTTPVLKFEHIDINVQKDYYYWVRAVDFCGNRSTWATNSKTSATRDIKHYFDGSNYYIDYMLDSGDVIYRMGSGNDEVLRLHQNGEINVHGYNSGYGYGDTNSIFTVGEGREIKTGVTASDGCSYIYSSLWDFKIGCTSANLEYSFIRMLTGGTLRLGYSAAGHTEIEMQTETSFMNDKTYFEGVENDANDDYEVATLEFGKHYQSTYPPIAKIEAIRDYSFSVYGEGLCVGGLRFRTYNFFEDTDGDFGTDTKLWIDGLANISHFYSHININYDNMPLVWGTGNDLLMYHDGTNSVIQNQTGDLKIKVNASDTRSADDTFTGSNADQPDTDKWGTFSSNDSALVEIQSNKLRFTYMGTSNGEKQYLIPKWAFNNGTDIEIQFDFDVYQQNSDYGNFVLYFYDEESSDTYPLYFEIYIYWGSTDKFYFGTGAHGSATDEKNYTHGSYSKMKMTMSMSGSDHVWKPYLYEVASSTWVELDDGDTKTWNPNGNIRMGISNGGNYHSRIGVDIDNFTVTTGTLTWDVPYVLGGTEAIAVDSSGDVEIKNDLTVTGDLYAWTTTAKTSSVTLTAAELNGYHIITNDGAGAEVNLSLLAGAATYRCHFIVTDAQYLKVTANGSEKFRYQGTEGAAGGYVRSNVVGTVFSITWSGDNWVIHGLEGRLKYDE